MFSAPANCSRPKTIVRADGREQDPDADYNGNPNLSLQNVPRAQLVSTCMESRCHPAISTPGLSFGKGSVRNNATASPPGRESR